MAVTGSASDAHSWWVLLPGAPCAGWELSLWLLQEVRYRDILAKGHLCLDPCSDMYVWTHARNMFVPGSMLVTHMYLHPCLDIHVPGLVLRTYVLDLSSCLYPCSGHMCAYTHAWDMCVPGPQCARILRFSLSSRALPLPASLTSSCACCACRFCGPRRPLPPCDTQFPALGRTVCQHTTPPGGFRGICTASTGMGRVRAHPIPPRPHFCEAPGAPGFLSCLVCRVYWHVRAHR